jgi:hypothetical protein
MIQHLLQQYDNMIRPDSFVNNFKNMLEFEEWCYIGTIEDLEATLVEFEKYELYEHCQVIKSVIKSLLGSKIIFDTEF